VAHTLEQFRAKFLFFVGHITRMDSLFEASFSPLSSSGESETHHLCPDSDCSRPVLLLRGGASCSPMLPVNAFPGRKPHQRLLMSMLRLTSTVADLCLLIVFACCLWLSVLGTAAQASPLASAASAGATWSTSAARPSRLYCPTCEDIYALPQGGAVKQYKGLACPLDGFELVLFSLSGAVSSKPQHATNLQHCCMPNQLHSRPADGAQLIKLFPLAASGPVTPCCCLTRQDGTDVPVVPVVLQLPPFEGIASLQLPGGVPPGWVCPAPPACTPPASTPPHSRECWPVLSPGRGCCAWTRYQHQSGDWTAAGQALGLGQLVSPDVSVARRRVSPSFVCFAVYGMAPI